ncbi:MarR family winged helix-turn-helix transcriptional regulator [Clostridium estertheticum]|uniref:MarR family winged helix-turn-helix transcriptional regulator n=1 Tax=Clostridium estertheticum TaxID=238834 RepID=UPI001CF105B9|nr:MarR family winged helix-turn-helix transcriptional regulator [Clostridium estertheticum]MCB2357210.1 MarR family winged helix-turn-helix transcriptional regulator [Clostridium estertheticum]WAG39685.1 MarR family winged helix-turn-helix transcriptional regulator [Clostridium estertheticum]
MDNKAKKLTMLNGGIYRCTQQYLEKELKKFSLSIGTYPFLLALSRNEGVCQNKISNELNVDKAMATRNVRKLIELGYIRKEQNIEDARAYKLYVTSKGKEVIPEVIEIIKEWIEILVEGTSEEKIGESIEFLERVLKNGKKYKDECVERMNSFERDRK